MNVDCTQPVGTVLKSLFESLGIHEAEGCSCESLRAEMDFLGVDLCRAERERLIAALRDNAGNARWVPSMSALSQILALGKSAIDPLPYLFDEAVRLTEERYPHKPHENAVIVDCVSCG